MKPKDLVALVLLAAVWGGSFLFIRIAVPALGPFPLVAGRVTIASLVLWAGMRALGQRPQLRPHFRKLMILAAINAAIPFALIAAAELHLTASLAAMLNATVPLWGSVFAAVWLGERLNARRIAGLALGVVGVAVLVGWSPITLDRVTTLSILATLVATCTYAASGVYAKRALSNVPPPTLALGQQVAASVWLIAPGLWQLPNAHPTRAATLALLGLATVSTAVAYLLYFRLIAAVGPTKTSTVTYLIPVFGMAWGAFFLGESVTPGMLVGLGCILASLVLVNEVRFGFLTRRTTVSRAR